MLASKVRLYGVSSVFARVCEKQGYFVESAMLKLRCRHDVYSTVNYYTGDKNLRPEEKVGQWLGKGAERLGLGGEAAGVVEPTELVKLLAGWGSTSNLSAHHTETQIRLGNHARPGQKHFRGGTLRT